MWSRCYSSFILRPPSFVTKLKPAAPTKGVLMLATLRQRNFALLWLSGLISFAGDWALIIALPVFVYDMTGSALATGAMFIAQTLPRLLFSPLAGVFVDRWDRRRTLVAANLAQAAVLPILLLVRSPDWLWLLYLVAF